jgi:hypothetical protein
MKRQIFPPIVDAARRELRLVPEWLVVSLLNTFVIGFGFVMIMAVLP